MPIQHLLRRWGFVKLRRYGLELTSDGRILTKRPVLDDGTGGRVVGWRDGDVAIWKLSPWAEGSVSTKPAVAEVAAAVPTASPEPATPDIPAASPAAAPPSRPSARVMSAEVAGEPAVDEDDWEWTIALARARVAVDEAQAARPPEPAPPPRREAPPPAAMPPPRVATMPLPVVMTAPPREAAPATIGPPMPDDWMRPESTTGEYEDYRVSTTREIPRVPMPSVPRGAPPSTVIPVPQLPVVDAAICSRLEPVVRSSQTSSQSITGRFAKGTAPVDPPSAPREAAMLVEDTIPNLSIGDRTAPGVAAPRKSNGAAASEVTAVGERTKPGIALPPAARAVSLPSIKGRSAPR